MIVNESKNLSWEGEVRIADSFIKRALGLMFKKPRYALVFILPLETRINASIHGFFMLESIDVIFLDSNFRVVDVTTLKPWRIYIPKARARYIIEGPRGLKESIKPEFGDKIKWFT
ncbi:DUF192 domain-containing protein [Pyrococcus horikoshii]|uniref:UPF0127 protein PH1112 n=2 Tax=Pyrococcus horikoshii TaxID=53953 RepID=Y1112_PYRHO|nr:DUF192 domain-containing protein [Pyrococcus horikoshii]O58839.1 RecName: Full=UPF0127 protein PH1112 [Pyrococcus horikoshii OT3]BAA30211.1 115aa long hypothetical protein [Pyrococcus horikoshii OT3]HII61847.1 DUF192 domain-containing protein [Pyrococcus horikoshii]